MRLTLAAAVLALAWAVDAWADDNDWGSLAVVSSTMGVEDGRICVGEGSRGDLGCPAYAPQVMSSGLLSATNISATGNVQANRFIGDGSLLSGVTAASADRITSGTTSFVVVSDTGYISLTQASANTGWFSPYTGLVTLGVNSTGGISGTTGYFNGRVGIYNPAPAYALHISAASYFAGGGQSGRELVMTQFNTTSTASGHDLDASGPNGALSFSTTGSERVRIAAAGMGLWTTAPSATLHVSGSLMVNNGTAAGLAAPAL